jgi:hypothetical protein
LAAPLNAGPALEVTFESPSAAFDLKSDPVSPAFDAASEALAAVDWQRRETLLVNLADCRRTARDADNDMSNI